MIWEQMVGVCLNHADTDMASLQIIAQKIINLLNELLIY